MMDTAMKIEIDNLKCGGCEATILKGLNAIQGVSQVKVDHAHQRVEVNAPEDLRGKITDALQRMGYPERGSLSGLSAGLANAKSFVSCAIGRAA
ncbi:heavy-metal-associated domain-containing protein [Variovorax sp. PCZ-1]|uniref:heavy-metal-associated domain-containing protein n=1 Tax=Variovorax sp. PCZ-1 TaxID=2835533 RepID=UPI001BCFECFA|nr:heavy-metal-associated domain-containing protein [Variovorax sp. PCZ-1]MBS7806577.1 heavy-metal-associated domain-containing protein [Variovorax sp. PCZ-1]